MRRALAGLAVAWIVGGGAADAQSDDETRIPVLDDQALVLDSYSRDVGALDDDTFVITYDYRGFAVLRGGRLTTLHTTEHRDAGRVTWRADRAELWAWTESEGRVLRWPAGETEPVEALRLSMYGAGPVYKDRLRPKWMMHGGRPSFVAPLDSEGLDLFVVERLPSLAVRLFTKGEAESTARALVSDVTASNHVRLEVDVERATDWSYSPRRRTLYTVERPAPDVDDERRPVIATSLDGTSRRTELAREPRLHGVEPCPDERHLLVRRSYDPDVWESWHGAGSGFFVIDLDSGEVVTDLPTGEDAIWYAPGFVLYVRDYRDVMIHAIETGSTTCLATLEGDGAIDALSPWRDGDGFVAALRPSSGYMSIRRDLVVVDRRRDTHVVLEDVRCHREPLVVHDPDGHFAPGRR